MERVRMQFDFKLNNDFTPLFFQHPVKIIMTYKLSEIKTKLLEIESAINDGYYAAGYLSYEAAYAFFNVPYQNKSPTPLLYFALFQNPVTNFTPNHKENHYSIGNWRCNVPENAYMDKVREIKQLISNGSTSQINYTVKFNADFSGHAYPYYQSLRNAQAANFSAYLQFASYEILSASPELFFHLKNGKITLRPMKGTSHRGKTANEDKKLKHWLQTSEKNRTENDLITQLMLDELTPISKRDTAQITKRYDVEQYPTVWQMTSTLTSELKENITFSKIIQALFPCSSIAGVPKEESLNIIKRIEHGERGIYCGTIGYITPEHEAVFNVAIRTVTVDRERNLASYGAGGAITAKSNAREEFDEVITKTKVLSTKQQDFELLETLGLFQGQFFLLDRHLYRLCESARYFNFSINLSKIENALNELAREHSQGDYRVRLTVQDDGGFSLAATPLTDINNNLVTLANQPINKADCFFYHKTTNRKIYETHLHKLDKQYFDVLLWNDQQEITEFTIGNVVVEIDGQLFTPPISTGILAGTFRQQLIAEKVIEEKVIKLSDLEKCTRIWLINSVRKWLPVHLKT